MTSRNWCCTATEEPSPNSRCNSRARCPFSAPKTSSTLAPKNSATTRALSVNAVSTSRETFSNSLRTNSASIAACSRESTRAPISTASEITRTGSSPASVRSRTSSAATASSTQTFSISTRPSSGRTRGWRSGVAASTPRTVRRAADGTSAHGEPAQRLKVLARDVERGDVGMARSRTAELDERIDGARLSLEDRLDGPVRAVAHPAGDAAGLRLPAHGVAEEDALHPAVGADPPADARLHDAEYRSEMTELASELGAAGGPGAPPAATARLRDLLGASLRHGREDLELPRSGYGEPVEIGLAADGARILAATPAHAALRADPQVATGRAWLLVAATVAAMVDLAGAAAPTGADDLRLEAGELPGGFLALAYPAPGLDPDTLAELGPLAFEDHAGRIDRLRARAVALPARLLGSPELRAPIGTGHPLHVAEAVARLGGRPEDPASVEAIEESLEALLAPRGQAVRPHEDPDPARRMARRILQRLDGMGKWGGYHTDFAHLPRGFAGNDRALAIEVGEALLAAGLLDSKPSVGQRHVFLNPRRAADIRRFIDSGVAPPGMSLPQS